MKRLLVSILFLGTLSLSTISLAKSSVSISLSGVENPVRENIEKRLNIMLEKLGSHPEARQIKVFYDQAQEQITKAMQPYGYFKPTIQGMMRNDNNKTRLHFTISPGEPLRLQRVEFHIVGPGQLSPQIQALHEQFPLTRGSILSINTYEKVKTEFIDELQAAGYIDSKWRQAQIKIDLERYNASIILELDTGDPYYFGKVTFSGSVLNDQLMQRYIPFKTGEPFSAKKLLALEDALHTSNYFEKVTVQAKPATPHDRTIPILVNVSMKKRQAYNIAVGYGTDSKFRGSLSTQWRYLNAYGHKLDAQIAASDVKRGLEARYTIPGNNPLTEQYVIAGNIFDQETNSVDGKGEQISGTFIGTEGEWTREYGVSILFGSNKNNNEPNSQSKMLYPSFTWQLKHSDAEFNQHFAYRFDLKLLGTTETFLSNVSFFQVDSEFKWIAPIYDGTRLIGRGTLGYNSTTSTKLPVTLRLFAGGSESIRGFHFQSIPNEGVARYLLTGSLELQQRIKDKWYGTLYYDFGDAFQNPPLELKQSVGLGLLRETPFGVIQMSVARTLVGQKNPYHFVLSVGPDL